MRPLNLPVLSCSLDPMSRSRILAGYCTDTLREGGHRSELIDLVEIGLPPFDNHAVFDSPAFVALHEKIRTADGVVLAFPIYNWAPGAGVKTIVESTGATGDGRNTSAWFDKPVTFVCSAGLPHSYMATGSLASSLMLDFKCIINPYTAYVSGRDWDGDVLSPERSAWLDKTLKVHVELTGLLGGRTYSSTWEV